MTRPHKPSDEELEEIREHVNDALYELGYSPRSSEVELAENHIMIVHSLLHREEEIEHDS